MNKTLIYIFISILLISGSHVSAEDLNADMTEPASVYEYPEISPAGDLFLGYRWLDYDNSKWAEEYEEFNDSVTASTESRFYFFPHRLHLDIDYKNRHDYFGDLRYAYGDLILFRVVNRTIFHNLGKYDLDPTGTDPRVSIRDEDEDSDVWLGVTNASLRYKTPDFPLHLFAGGELVQKQGTVQQRSLLGSGLFGNIIVPN